MNFPYFISRRITHSTSGSFSATISKIAVVSISVGLTAMVLAFFILGGFQRVIKDKIYDFKGHIEVSKFDMGSVYDEQPVAVTPKVLDQIYGFETVDHVQYFAHKSGMIKTDEEVEGIHFKGVSHNFSLERFQDNLVEGRFVAFDSASYSKEVVLSQWIANRLKLKVGDDAIIYFVQNPPRVRKLEIVGLYETGLEEIDRSMVIGDIQLVQKLNNWPDSLVGGLEVFVNDQADIAMVDDGLYETLDATYYVEMISKKYGHIFDWLDLLDQNVNVFLGLILMVACFNMISIILILIMERTNMVGVLLALGSSQQQIKNVFLYNGMILIMKGMLIGNGVAILFAFLQQEFHLIPLDAENYYMPYVPIYWDIKAMVLVNLMTFLVVSLTLYIPLAFVARISPIKALKFD